MHGIGIVVMICYPQNKEINELLPSDFTYVKAEDLYRWHWNISQPNQILPNEKFVINCSDEIFDQQFVLDVNNYYSTNHKNFIITCGALSMHQVKPNIFYYPDSYYWSRKKLAYPDQVDLVSPRQYVFSCLNGTPWPHRIKNYLALRKSDCYDNFLFTMHDNTNFEFLERNFKLKLTDDERLLWKELSPSWPTLEHVMQTSMQRQGTTVPLGTNIDAYQNSYIHLITESHIERPSYISEKTWKSISNGQLFIMLGGVNTISDLRLLGVDCFDDYIDHDYYDQEIDPVARINKIQNLVKDLNKLNVQEIWHKTESRRNQNIVNFLNGSFGRKYLEQILSKLTDLI